MSLSLNEFLEKYPVDMDSVERRKKELLDILEDYRNKEADLHSEDEQYISSIDPMSASREHNDLSILFKSHPDDELL